MSTRLSISPISGPHRSTLLRALLLIGVLGTSWGCDQAREADRGARGRAPTPVVVQPVQFEVQRTRIDAVGTASALRSVELFAESAGDVVAINFEPGDFVEAGTVLVELEARDQRLALQLAEVRIEEAQRLYDRYTSANDRGDGLVAETIVDTARTSLQAARIERDRAQVALDKRVVIAPFDGYVGLSDIDVGDRVDTSTAVTTLDDRTLLLVSFDVPEAFAGRVAPGDAIAIEAWTASRATARGRVVDVGSRVDPMTRAFTARAEVPNEGDVLRPGMSFRVALDLEGASWPAVPEVSLQWGGDGAYVWIFEQGQARRIPASIVQRMKGRVLVDADLPAGALVVEEGVQSMREGLAVRAMDARRAVPCCRRRGTGF